MHCFRTQPHMRFHFYVTAVVLLSGLLLNLETRDMLALVFAMALVIVAEMFNTAIEAVVDMITETYNPAAKVAKDVAAGAVLMAAANALIVATLIFFGQKKLLQIQDRMQHNLTPDITYVVIVGIVLMVLIVIISKLRTGSATPWHGGVVSGHSAIGFFLAMTIFFTAHNTAIAVLAILLAILVAQSRVEARVHTLQEVVLGAVLAIFVTSLVYWVWPHLRGMWGQGRPPAAAVRMVTAPGSGPARAGGVERFVKR